VVFLLASAEVMVVAAVYCVKFVVEIFAAGLAFFLSMETKGKEGSGVEEGLTGRGVSVGIP